MNQPASEFFHPNISEYIAQTIESHGGSEVFFTAWVDRDGRVSECEAIAFGNDESVPAPLAEGLKADLVIHNHPSGDLRASNADINIASLLATKKLGFYIINNDCSVINIVYKPKPRFFLPEQEVLAIFQDKGLLAECIGSYEERPQQEELVSKIISAINNDNILAAEAGTGTGKSLSYLIPAAVWAVKSEKRVFVTTHTITLQNQIAKKDAELVSSIVERYTGIKPRFAVLVGRGNYLCPKNLNELLYERDKTESLFDNPQQIKNELEIISLWSEGTQSGLRSEIPERISSELWEELSASTPNCPRKECPFYTECFYFKARMTAEASHIIIGNHSLLLASIDDDNGFISTIPHFSGVVIDEAHSLPNITLGAMAESFSFGGIIWRISRLYRQKGSKFFGQLNLLHDRAALEQSSELFQLFTTASNSILELSGLTRQKEEEFLNIIGNYQEPYIEITQELLSQSKWITAKKILTELFDHVKFIESTLTKLSERTRELIPEARILEILRIIDIHNNAFFEMRQTFEKIFITLNDDSIAVKQLELTRNATIFSAGPADIGDFLSKNIFRPKDFTIFVSATLFINNTVNFFSQSIGLEYSEPERVDSIALSSPFDYKNQMKIFVIKEPSLPTDQLYSQKMDLVKQAVLTSGGGALLLFTSYKALEAAYLKLAEEFSDAGLYPLKQGDFSRDHLLNAMRTKDYTILFATSSFWEGIDIPGHHLRLLIIDKLPFDNPNNPLTKAVCRMLEEKNINSFAEYSVPRAVLKYKQGIGRLIRSKKDRGILIVLDSRIFSKSYGRNFVQAALPAESLYLTYPNILQEIKKFFFLA
ncbi:MAG: helicase C-terminal domain-containing protein [Brevinemataceae bacterium]